MKKRVLSLFTLVAIFLGTLFPIESLAVKRDLNVTRIAGSGRYQTAVEASRKTFRDSKYAIIASGEGFADALVGGTLASQVEAPILLTNKNSISHEVINELKRLDVEYVFLLGGVSTINKTVEDKIIQSGFELERLSGANRVETANAIAEKRFNLYGNFMQGYDPVGVSGNIYADALSAAPFVGQMKSDEETPLKNLSLYVGGNSDLNYSMVFGGKSSVPTSSGEKVRFQGTNRYGTAVEVAKGYKKYLEKDIDTIVLVDGTNYPDALASASVASMNNGAILLTDSKILSKETKNYIDSNENIENIIIVGGENSVSTVIEKELKGTSTTKPTDPVKPTDPIEESDDLDSLRNKPLNSLTGKQAMELYNAQPSIDSSKDLMIQNIGGGVKEQTIKPFNINIVNNTTIIIKDNQDQYRRVYFPGIDLVDGNYITNVIGFETITSAKDGIEKLIGVSNPDRISINRIHSVTNKDIVAEIVPVKGSTVMGLSSRIVSWGYATVNESFNFLPYGPKTPEEVMKTILSTQSTAKEYKRGVWGK